MPIRIVRLGSPRAEGEGLRIGTVRRPPRGVPKTKFAEQDWYDIWYPNLAPSAETLKQGLAASSEREWQAFRQAYRREMAVAESARSIALLAGLSHHANFSVGCYCEDEAHCHRSVLRDLLASAGAELRG
ncbi:MAG TPA: DUF488 family protein [Rudaea sp.]|jgi:uncharacterized protein YeaO (DUF488 family)|nr:DUF488 family protein [Rudaea sp.]